MINNNNYNNGFLLHNNRLLDNYKPLLLSDNNKHLLSNNDKHLLSNEGNTANINENIEVTTENNNNNFLINQSDVLFTITFNKNTCTENVTTLIGKMLILRETTNINLLNLSKVLGLMQLDKLYIFSINPNIISGKIDISTIRESSLINYIELGVEDFVKFLNRDSHNFSDYNKDSLYILRDGSYIDIKKMLTKINGCVTKIGRGGSQKAHVLSPLDFRLSSYVMAMYNFNYKLISSLNIFNDLSKDRYLVYFEENKGYFK